MGVSINLHVYDKDKLVSDIEQFVSDNGGYRENALPAREFLEAVGNEFGRVTADEFQVVWNEYYDNYNPASSFLSAVERYYFPHDEDIDFWADEYKTYSNSANSSEVLGDVFEDEFGWEGRFYLTDEDDF